ncbi:hypothetical protein BpHYR1_006337 [Brachionus plicatilis]|uniref:Uncharacterized protein n=1 Tax=Brachionus plicatilis TaxID=10195 RepID=A0A3M7RIT4_BRAPC|nr:hypothetical protein BpHYR1_006337 [Brachionus plicatilis]
MSLSAFWKVCNPIFESISIRIACHTRFQVVIKEPKNKTIFTCCKFTKIYQKETICEPFTIKEKEVKFPIQNRYYDYRNTFFNFNSNFKNYASLVPKLNK